MTKWILEIRLTTLPKRIQEGQVVGTGKDRGKMILRNEVKHP